MAEATHGGDLTTNLHEGITDNSYMKLTPNRSNVQHPPVERLTWPTYAHVEVDQAGADPFEEAIAAQPPATEVHTRGTARRTRVG